MVMENRVRAMREELGMTQEELGDVVGVSRYTIISIERRRYLPSLPLAFKLAEVFGRRVDEVFFP
jgi:putative transcriptional regulator